MIADETAADFPNPGMTAYTAKADGKAGRYVRVTATKLAPRQNDYMLALAELEVFDADGKNLATGTAVTALDSIEARSAVAQVEPDRRPRPRRAEARQRRNSAKLTAARDTLLRKALGDDGAAELVTLRAQVERGRRGPREAAGAAQRVTRPRFTPAAGNFVGTGASGGKPRPIHILPRGDVTKPGKEVVPGALPAIPGLNGNFNLPTGHTEGDRRAALAKWLTDANNPLTWRVMANRVWQYHFGRGLVDTPNDFGKMGQLPTHPELLDCLAAELRDTTSR